MANPETERFKKMKVELEELAAQNPGQYRMRVIGLAVAGYLYIWLVMILLTILTLILLVLCLKMPVILVKAGIPLLLLLFVIARSFWVKFDPVVGIYLKRDDAPILFEAVESIRQKLGAPNLHHVVLVPEFNAAISQIPRLGILGFPKNHLLVGMELMQATSPEQFKSVLAHEMGHLSGNHGRFMSWVYSARIVWAQLMSSLAQDSSFATLLFRKFFNWYVPYFDAYTFVLARQQEYEADRCAVEVSGPDSTAHALITTRVKSAYVNEKYWKSIFKRTKDETEPPACAYTDLGSVLMLPVEQSDAELWLDRALKEKTDYDDTHPCLKERLSNILSLAEPDCEKYAQSTLDESLTRSGSAAQHFFGDRLEHFLGLLDSDWKTGVTHYWSDCFEQYKAIGQQLNELEKKASDAELSADESIAFANKTAQIKSFAEARPLFQSALEKYSDNASLHFAMGDWLSTEDGGHDDCIVHLERAMELDEFLGYECSNIIYGYLKFRGRDEEAEKWLEKGGEYYIKMMASAQERGALTAADHYEPAQMTAEEIEQLVAQLAVFPKIKNAFFARKNVSHFPDRPCYVFIIEVAWQFYKAEDADQKLVAEISGKVSFPGETIVSTLQWAPPQLKKLFKTNPETLIYARR